MIRLFLLVEGLSFLLASLVHAGRLVPGYEHPQARVAESVIGTVLVLGWLWTLIRPVSLRRTALVVQGFALLGTLVGVFTILVGVGPGTAPDVAYHVAIVVILGLGLRAAVKLPPPRSVR